MAGTPEVYPKWHWKLPYLMGLKTFVASNRTDPHTHPKTALVTTTKVKWEQLW